MDVWLIVFFSLVALGTSFFSVITGGAGLILTPLMLAFGVPPANAISSAKFSFLGTSATGTYRFQKVKNIDYRIAIPLAAFALIGGIIGSNSVMVLDPMVIQGFMGAFMIFILVISYIFKDLGEKDYGFFSPARLILGGVILLFSQIISTVTGGGSAILNTYILILVFGQSIIHSAGTQAIINDISLLAIIGIFTYNGLMLWTLAVPLFFASTIGGYLGATYGVRMGTRWIKNIFLFVVCTLALKLIIPLALSIF